MSEIRAQMSNVSAMAHVHDNGWGNCYACLDEFRTMKAQVQEIYVAATQMAAVFQQMQSHPMLSAFMPRGL